MIAPDALLADTGALVTIAAGGDPIWHAFWARFGGRVWCTDAVKEELDRRVDRIGETWLRRVRGTMTRRTIGLKEDADLREIEELRSRLAREGDPPTMHIGEASTIVAVRRWGGIAVIDDRDGFTLAKSVGIRAVRWLDLFKVIIQADELTCSEAWAGFRRMRQHARLPDLPRRELCPPACGRHR